MRILNSCKLLGHQIYSEQQSRKLNVVCAFNVVILRDILYEVWQYRLWSFQTGDTKLERFLPKNQHTQRKLLNFEFWINGELSKRAKI